MDGLTALTVFRHVAELGGFAAVGRRLGLSPPAISKNIAELEAALGARLINRTTCRMALTEEGRIYFEHARRVLEALWPRRIRRSARSRARRSDSCASARR